ncbi:MAG: restriction endonuclease subunit S [Pyrinomonadaceae bacterium]
MFAVRRGDCKTQRFDADFWSPNFRLLEKQLDSIFTKEIGSIAEFSEETWNRNDEVFEKTFPYLEISAVELGTNSYSLEDVAVQDAPSRARMFLRGGDVVISTTRPHRGAIARIRSNDAPCIGSTGFAVLRKVAEKIDGNFLFNLLNTKTVLNQFLRRSTGGNYPAITVDEIKLVRVPVVSPEIQRALVEEMEQARESRREKLAAADALLQSLDGWLLDILGIALPPADNRQTFAIPLKEIENERLDSFYYLPQHIKTENELRKIKDKLVNLGSQLDSPPMNGLDARNYKDTGQRYLRVQNIKPFDIETDDVKFVQVDLKKDIFLQVDDVLLTRKGTFGISAIVTPENAEDLISSEVIQLRVSKDSNILPYYLVCWLNCSIAQNLLDRLKTGGIMGHITQSVVKSFPVPNIDRNTQEEIIENFSNLRKESKQMKIEAKAEWQAAKDGFEAALLAGGEK